MGSAFWAFGPSGTGWRFALASAPPDCTCCVWSKLHNTASRALSGRRLAEYLAAELRGSILASGTDVEIRDAMARGLAQKRFPVAPRPFTGERLQVPADVPVGGYPPARVELYLARGAERPAIQVAFRSRCGSSTASTVG